MTGEHRRQAPGAQARPWARWHRRLGVSVSALVLLLSVTGIMLNHTSDLGLDRRFVRAQWLLEWYGIAVPHAPIAFAVGTHWLGHIGTRVYFDARELGDVGVLAGAVALPSGIAVAAGDKVLLLTPDGETIEALGREHGVPAEMRAIGVSGGAIAVQTASGIYVADADLMRWHARPSAPVRWAAPRAAPAALQTQWEAAYRGNGLSVERLVRDLHSGRAFGRVGRWLMDLAALAFLILAATGLWLWRRRRGQHK